MGQDYKVSMMKKQMGFTLIELMITVTIAGVILTLALPAFNQFLQNNRTTSQVNDFIAVMSLARSEAIGRNRQVQIIANGGVWTDGWIIMADVDRNESFGDADDQLIQSYEAMDRATLTSAVTEITFRSNGLIIPEDPDNPNDPVLMNLVAANCEGENDRLIEISMTGKVNITRNTC